MEVIDNIINTYTYKVYSFYFSACASHCHECLLTGGAKCDPGQCMSGYISTQNDQCIGTDVYSLL